MDIDAILLAAKGPKGDNGDPTLSADLTSTDPGKGAELVSRGTLTVDNFADIADVPAGVGQRGISINLISYHDGINKGGGQFCWNSTSTDADDGGTIVTPTGHSGAGRWVRQLNGPPDVSMFGARGDDSNDDGAIIRNVLVWAGAAGITKVTIQSDGVYRIYETLEIDSRVHLIGGGWNCILKPMMADGTPCVWAKSPAGYYNLDGFRIVAPVDVEDYKAGLVNAQDCIGIRLGTSQFDTASRYRISHGVQVIGCKVGYDIISFIGDLDIWTRYCDIGVRGKWANAANLVLRSELCRKDFELVDSNGIHLSQPLAETSNQVLLAASTLDGCNGVTLTAPYFEFPDRQVPVIAIGKTTLCRAITINGMTSAIPPTTGTHDNVVIEVDKCDGIYIQGYYSTGFAHSSVSFTPDTKNIVNAAALASGFHQDGSLNLSQIRNHFPNPSFDLWLRGWQNLTVAGCVLSREQSIVRRGKNAIRLTAISSETTSRVTFRIGDSLGQHVSDKTLTAYAWVWIPKIASFDPAERSAMPCKPTLTLLSNNGVTSTSNNSANYHTVWGAWNLMCVTHTMQADCSRVEITFSFNKASGAVGDEYAVIDSVYLVEGDNGQYNDILHGHIVDSDVVTSTGIGGRMVMYADSVPTSPLQIYEAGDRVNKLTPAVSQSPGWVCTTGGTGGTAVFTPLANL